MSLSAMSSSNWPSRVILSRGVGRSRRFSHSLSPAFRDQYRGCLVRKLDDVSRLLIGNIDPIQASCKLTGQANAHHLEGIATAKNPPIVASSNSQNSRFQRRTVTHSSAEMHRAATRVGWLVHPEVWDFTVSTHRWCLGVARRTRTRRTEVPPTRRIGCSKRREVAVVARARKTIEICA
jgi:hypothetical protein